MTGAAAGVRGSAAGAAAASAIPQLPMPVLSLTAPTLGGALSMSMIDGPIPVLERGPLAVAKSMDAARLEVVEAVGEISKGSDSGSRPVAARMMDRLLGLEEASSREPVATVNSFEQIESAGALANISASMRDVRPEKPRPPQPDGGGFHRGAWAKLTGFLRVLPDKERNRQFWIYAAGQALVTIGVNFHYTALPKLVAPTKEDGAQLGYNRAINWGAQAGAALLAGPIVDRTSTQKVIIWTNVGRSLLMMLVPVLFFQGFLGFGVFAGLIAVAGSLQMANMTAGSVAFNRILADDVEHYNRANAILTIAMNVAGVIGPLLAGGFIALVGAHFGLLGGNAMAYAVYGVLLLACAVGYGLFLKLPRDEMMAAAVVPAEFGGFPVKAVARRRVLKEVVAGVKMIVSDRFLRWYLLATTVSVMLGDVLIFAAMPRFLEEVLHAGAGSFGVFLSAAALGSGLGSGLMAFARDPEQMALAPLARVFRSELAAREPTLDVRALDAASASLRYALPAVLARYREERAKGGAAVEIGQFGADLVVEGAKAVGLALGRPEAEASALLEATSAASDLRAWASSRGVKLLTGAYADVTTGMDRLQRQGRWTSWLHGLSWLAYAALFFSGNFYLAVTLMLLSTILGAPAIVAWTSLTTRVVSGSYHESQGKIYSAMYFYQLICAIVGALIYAGFMAALPTLTVLWIAAGVMVLCALIDFLSPALIFPIARKR